MILIFGYASNLKKRLRVILIKSRTTILIFKNECSDFHSRLFFQGQTKYRFLFCLQIVFKFAKLALLVLILDHYWTRPGCVVARQYPARNGPELAQPWQPETEMPD